MLDEKRNSRRNEKDLMLTKIKEKKCWLKWSKRMENSKRKEKDLMLTEKE